ncbi:transposable element Tcb2 transposase [Trichonephila clavipes]|nr:transposable element Tcb2 transposase [Trichonephila clavipes]
MARIVRHNDESVREGYIRNGGKEVKLFTSALKDFQCNNRIVMAQRKHLNDFLPGRIIRRLLIDSLRTLIWRAPGTRYNQENTIKRHRYGGAGWLIWGGIILGSRTDMHAQSVTITGHIYRGVILEQHVRLFWGAMGAEFPFMDDNARPHRANIVDE